MGKLIGDSSKEPVRGRR